MANNRRAAAIWHNTTWPWCEWNRKSEQQEAREQSRFWASAENERRNKKPLHWVETCRLSFHFRSLAECANYWCEWNHLGHESLSTTPHRVVRTAASCRKRLVQCWLSRRCIGRSLIESSLGNRWQISRDSFRACVSTSRVGFIFQLLVDRS